MMDLALITGLGSLLAITYLVAVRSPSRPTTVRPAGDPEAELRRLLGDARLGAVSQAHQRRT